MTIKSLQPVQRDHALAGQWIHVFSGGKQTDSTGRVKDWTDAELDEMVASFADEPPRHVIEHDELYSPFAFGRPSEIKRDGDNLFVRSKDGEISPLLDKLVDDGAVNERSVRIIKDHKGRWQLGHIAWLGAAPPAVAGLEPVRRDHGKTADEAIAAIKAQGLEPVTLDHSAGDDAWEFAWKEERKLGLLARMWDSMRDLVVEKWGLDTANRLFPKYEREAIDDMKVDEAVESRTPSPESTPGDVIANPNYSRSQQEGLDVPDPTKKDEEPGVSRADFAMAQARTAALEHQLAVRDAKDLVGQAVRDGKMTPAMASGFAEFMASLPDGNDAVEFSFSRAIAGDKDAKTETVKRTPRDFARDFIASLPQIVKPKADDGEDEGDPPDVADHEAVAEKALEYQRQQDEAGKSISIAQAVAHVQAQEA